MKPTRRGMLAALGAFLLVFAQVHIAAQEVYPNRPIKIIVPFPPGGIVDALTRVVAEKLSVKFGQPVIVENKAGATGNIGAELVANARPDGYTLLSTPPPPLVINQSLFKQLPFDPVRFVPITVIAGAPNVLVGNAKLRANNAGELIAQAKEHPGMLNYASTGSGGTPHVTAEWFKSAVGVQITHIPYKGAQAYPALLAGDVDVMFMPLSDALPHIRSGRLKALAVGSEKRIAALPGVHTLAETVPGFVSTTWIAIVATPGTSPAIAGKLYAAIDEALQLPEIRKMLVDLNLDPIGGSPAETAAFLKEEAERWNKVLRSAQIKAD